MLKHCDCPIGYLQRYSGECVDEDECDYNNSCQHLCVNTEGSFHCSCDEGYKLDSNGSSCVDINECHESNGGCEFGCRNTISSYECYCYHGYELKNETHCDTEIKCIVVENIENEDYRFSCHGDYNLTITNFTCENILQTTDATSPSTTTIVSTASTTVKPTTTPSPDCPIGYLQRYTGECVDENECVYDNKCQQLCINTEGSFHCDCNEGYKLDSNGSSCADINECHELNGGCEFGCRNTIGSYQCYCYHGYELKNGTHCDTELQCIVIRNIDSKEYRFSCAGNYNLTITNFTCENTPQTPTTAMSTTVATLPTIVSILTGPNGFPIGYEVQCDIVQDDTYQGNYFTCREGFNLMLNNLTYSDCIDHAMIQNTENPPTAVTIAATDTTACGTSESIQSSTIIMFTVLIFIILIQTVIIILVLLCSFAMRRTARNPKVQQNIRQAHFHENNLAIPLEDIIEKQPYATPDTMEKIQGNSEITSIPKCENIY